MFHLVNNGFSESAKGEFYDKDSILFTRLEEASSSGDLDTVQDIWTSNDQLDVKWLTGCLTAAVLNNNLSIASYLLSQGAPIDIVHIKYAIEAKSYEFLQLFLANGWDINTEINSSTPPPLMLALDDEHLTRWLLSHGANPNAGCALDLTPLSIAVEHATFDVINLLFENGGSIRYGQLLHYAVRRDAADRLEVLSFILKKAPPINNVMYQDRLDCYYSQMAFGIGTPLHEAAEMGKLDVVRMLLGHGADPLIRDARGLLAVERAKAAGHLEVAEYLNSSSVPFSSTPRSNFTDGRRVSDI